MRNTEERGKEAIDFQTPYKTLTNTLAGFAGASISQPVACGNRNIACEKCGVECDRLYPGGTGKPTLLCAGCLWPKVEPKTADVHIATQDDDEFVAEKRTIRLVRCYVCEQPRAQSAMSVFGMICHSCLVHDGSRQARLRLEKGLLRIIKAVRRAAACT